MKFYNIGGYNQAIGDDASCDCMWGTIHRDAWKEGKKICKHLSEAIKKHGKEKETKKQN